VDRNNAGDDDDERSGRSADLSFGSAQRGNQESGHDRAIDAGLRRQARGDGEGHRQRKGDKADCDSGNQIEQEFVAVIVTQAEDRFWKPAVVRENTSHCCIMSACEVRAYSRQVRRCVRKTMSGSTTDSDMPRPSVALLAQGR